MRTFVRIATLLLVPCACARTVRPIGTDGPVAMTDANAAESTDAIDGPPNPLDVIDVIDVIDPIDAGTACPAGMVRIPGGTFLMGAAPGDVNAFPPEYPPHRVTLGSFCMDLTEVTVAAYRSCLGCAPPDDSMGCNAGVTGRDDHPVNCVDWTQATAYCNSRGARLPTEAEWEYAARGTDARIYPWGAEPPTCERVNFTNGATVCVGTTTPVGIHRQGRSAFGVEDMAGNVAEWVNDWWDPAYYRSPAASAPNPQGPATSPVEARIRRGGGFDVGMEGIRCSDRNANVPYSRYANIGFRCASGAE